MKFSSTRKSSTAGTYAERMFAGCSRQIVHADRLGTNAYAVIEHFAFPKFRSRSTRRRFRAPAAAQGTRLINFRTLLHPPPYYNPVVLAAPIVQTDILTAGATSGVGRGHGWSPPKVGVPLARRLARGTREALEVLTPRARERALLVLGSTSPSRTPPSSAPDRKFRVFLGGTSDRTYELRPRKAGRSWCRRSFPTRR